MEEEEKKKKMGGMEEEEEKKSMQKFDFNIIKIKPCRKRGKNYSVHLICYFFLLM